MILPAPLALPSQNPRDIGVGPTYPVQNSRDLGVVRAFVQNARIGLDPDVVLPPYAEPGEQPVIPKYLNDPEDVRKFRHIHYRYNNAEVYVDIDSGRISGYHDFAQPPGGGINEADGSPTPRRVTNAQAVALAQRFYTAAGWPGGLAPFEHEWGGKQVTVRDGMGNGASLEIVFVPTAGGVPYDSSMYQGLIGVHRQTGQLTDFSGPDRMLPSPPAVLKPTGSVAAARALALRAGVELRGESLAESPYVPMKLCIWRVRMYQNETPDMLAKRYPARTIASLRANRGLLVYKGWLLGGRVEDAVDATIDALTGEVLALEPVPASSPGGAGGGMKGFPVPVPTAAVHWQVATGAKGWKAWSAPARAGLALVLGTKATGSKVVLTDGRAAFAAVYDAKANVLGIGDKAYRPGPALAILLRKRAKG